MSVDRADADAAVTPLSAAAAPGPRLVYSPASASPFTTSPDRPGDQRSETLAGLDGRLFVRISAHPPTQWSLCRGNRFSVLVDGYVSEAANRPVAPDRAAERVLDLVRETGLACVQSLRGSYTILIVDDAQGTVHVITDRRRSRPLFYRVYPDGALRLGPEVAELARADPGLALSPTAVAEFLIFGSYCADHTLFGPIRAVPQAAIMSFSPRGHRTERYWRLRFEPEPAPPADLVERAEALIRAAVQRLVRSTRTPFLYLSGGVDSRVVLGALLATGNRLPVVAFGTSSGDDLATATRLAADLALDLTTLPIEESGLEQLFTTATADSDCRAETLDSPAACRLNRALGARFRTFFNGDETFGWHYRPVKDHVLLSRGDAIRAIGLRPLARVARLRDWLLPEAMTVIEAGLEQTIDDLTREAAAETPVDLMDTLYFGQRLGNMLNAFTGQRLRFMEQARPLIDEDVVDFVSRLPRHLRYDKRLLRRVLTQSYPQLMKVPLATRDSIPTAETFRRLFREEPAMQSFVRTRLLDDFDPRLRELFDLGRVRAAAECLFAGKVLPSLPAPSWARLPGLWRFHRPISEVHPVSLMLRLLQLNLYLRSCA